MKKNELQKMIEKNVDELKKQVDEKKKEIAMATLKMHVGKEKNLKKVRMLRKEVAQLLTIISSKEGKEVSVEEVK